MTSYNVSIVGASTLYALQQAPVGVLNLQFSKTDFIDTSLLLSNGSSNYKSEILSNIGLT